MSFIFSFQPTKGLLVFFAGGLSLVVSGVAVDKMERSQKILFSVYPSGGVTGEWE